MTTNRLLALHNRVAALERRMAQSMRHGAVAEVNAAEGWVRLDLGEGDAGRLLSPKVPYAQFAGALKVHTPPTVGQNMTLLAPTGDPRQAIAIPMTWSDQFASPSDSGAENVLTFGDVRVTIEDNAITAVIGGFTLKISAAGLAMAGGGIGHNGRNIGATHTHGGVEPGGGSTDEPSAGGPTP